MPFKDSKKKKIYLQNYYKNHKNEILNHSKKNYEENKNEILIQRKEYYKKNRKEILIHKKKYNQTEKGKSIRKKAQKKYYEKNKDKILIWNKEYRLSEFSKEIIQNYSKKYYINHKSEIIIKIKQYVQTKRGRETLRRASRKAQHKRRGLGNTEINRKFRGSHGHHIDKEHIIYIPKDLHNSVRHNIWTGKGMIETNRKIFEWLAIQENIIFN